MRRKIQFAVITVLAALISAAMPASAHPRAGGGGGVPSPRMIASTNHHVELADGELYTLEGRLVVDSTGALYFNVDLRKHPWLASAERVKNPYYAVEADPSAWQAYVGKRILLVAVARVVVGGGEYQIVLQPVNDNPDHSIARCW